MLLVYVIWMLLACQCYWCMLYECYINVIVLSTVSMLLEYVISMPSVYYCAVNVINACYMNVIWILSMLLARITNGQCHKTVENVRKANWTSSHCEFNHSMVNSFIPLLNYLVRNAIWLFFTFFKVVLRIVFINCLFQEPECHGIFLIL